MTRELSMSRAMAEMADSLVDDFDVVDMLTTVADSCAEVLNISAAGVMLIAPSGEPPAGDLRVLAMSRRGMAVAELFELQTEEGPALDCYRSGEPLTNQQLAGADNIWPRFAAAARHAGFHATDAIPLRSRRQSIGALNFLREEASPLDHDDIVAAQTLADVATVAVLHHNAARRGFKVVEDQLRHAFDDRIVIEQAKGMIAERDGIDIQQAFLRIRRRAQIDRHRLAEVAADIVSGTLNPPALDLG